MTARRARRRYTSLRVPELLRGQAAQVANSRRHTGASATTATGHPRPLGARWTAIVRRKRPVHADPAPTMAAPAAPTPIAGAIRTIHGPLTRHTALPDHAD